MAQRLLLLHTREVTCGSSQWGPKEVSHCPPSSAHQQTPQGATDGCLHLLPRGLQVELCRHPRLGQGRQGTAADPRRKDVWRLQSFSSGASSKICPARHSWTWSVNVPRFSLLGKDVGQSDPEVAAGSQNRTESWLTPFPAQGCRSRFRLGQSTTAQVSLAPDLCV